MQIRKILFFLLLTVLITPVTEAQKKKKKKEKPVAEAEAKKKKAPFKKFSEVTKGHTKIDGLFTLYQDTLKGSLKMHIKPDQIGKEYIHFYYVENAPLESGGFKGQFRGSRVLKIERYFDQLQFNIINTNFYFDKENPLSKASRTGLSDALAFSGKIIGYEKGKGYIIDVDPLFLKETVGLIKPPPSSKPNPNAFNLGGLSSSKTGYDTIRNYDKNTDIVVNYHFENSSPKNWGSKAITDARNVKVTVQHSLIQMPENDFEPRYDDPRVGYFTTQVTDLTSTELANYKDFIHKWNLKKRDPNAQVSEPIKPIVYWIENTTPKEWIPSIKEGVLSWNKAFEKAGFKNAIQVKVQSDTATWDAGDIKYNVLRWTSSPNTAFGGYGPSFVNPRTGEILGADIMLEFSHYKNRALYERLFIGDESADLSSNDTDNLDYQKLWGMYAGICLAGQIMQENNALGALAVKAIGKGDFEESKIRKQSMVSLVAHEVGHTLGLNHNMKSTHAFTLDQVYSKSFTENNAFIGSVMDYDGINLVPDESQQGNYYSTGLGPYDYWAIYCGYHPFETKEAHEKALERSTEKKLVFGNDADDMRRPGRGIDPRVNTSDLTDNPIQWSIDRIEYMKKMDPKLIDIYQEKGDYYNEFMYASRVIVGQQLTALGIISRYIGGVYVDRSTMGQPGGTVPHAVVSYKDQKKAMNALSKYAFSPNAFVLNPENFTRMAPQRRGFDLRGRTEDPKLHQQYLGIQNSILAQLLHQNTMQRIVDTSLYGNKYNLNEMMDDLTNAIFKADRYSSVSTLRQNLQMAYTKRLIGIINPKSGYMDVAKSAALYELNKINAIAKEARGNASTRAHKQHLKLIIKKALEA